MAKTSFTITCAVAAAQFLSWRRCCWHTGARRGGVAAHTVCGDGCATEPPSRVSVLPRGRRGRRGRRICGFAEGNGCWCGRLWRAGRAQVARQRSVSARRAEPAVRFAHLRHRLRGAVRAHQCDTRCGLLARLLDVQAHVVRTAPHAPRTQGQSVVAGEGGWAGGRAARARDVAPRRRGARPADEREPGRQHWAVPPPSQTCGPARLAGAKALAAASAARWHGGPVVLQGVLGTKYGWVQKLRMTI